MNDLESRPRDGGFMAGASVMATRHPRRIGDIDDEVTPVENVTDPRVSWDDYFLLIAKAVAQRADCTRRLASAVIVKDHRIVSTGYNGAPKGWAGCASANGCPRGRLSNEELAAYSSYDEGPGRCIAVHAEANALLYADRDKTEGATLYTWSSTDNQQPCVSCWRLIAGAGIETVVFYDKIIDSATKSVSGAWVVRANAAGEIQRRQTAKWWMPIMTKTWP